MASKKNEVTTPVETPEQRQERINASLKKYNFKPTSELIDEYVNRPVYFMEPLSLSLGMNYVCPKTGLPGVPQGIIAEVAGGPGNLKSALAEQFAKNVLDADPFHQVACLFFEPCNFIRLKKVLGEDRMKRFHRLERSNKDDVISAEEGLHTLLNFGASCKEVVYCIVDSFGAMPTSRELFDKNGNFKPLDARAQLGHRANVITEFINQWNGLNPNTRPILIALNHMKDQIDTGDATVAQLKVDRIGANIHYESPGGKGFKFACDYRIKAMAKKPDPTTEAEKEKHAIFGNRRQEFLEGHFEIFKNKGCPEFGSLTAMGNFNLAEGRFDVEDEVISYADFLGYDEIRKAGAFIYVDPLKKNVRYDAAIEYLRKDNEFKLEMIRKIAKDRAQLFGTNKKSKGVSADEAL